MNRRTFLSNASKMGASFTILPSSVLGRAGETAPSDRLNLAIVGIAGRGSRHCAALKDADVNIVALCDVDWSERVAESFKTFPKAKRYRDFRVMFDKQKDIDAVLVSTPDHTHAVISLAAMKAGKHVYCEKPLAHSLHEVRVMTEAARKYGVQTQMGNQGHSAEHIRLLHEWLDDGAIGSVREVHAWTNRLSIGRFSTGGGRPQDTPPVPEDLDWDIWLGPTQYREYHPDYLPGKWRGWVDFGTGALGDMGCHILDPAFWALDLGSPSSVTASTSHMPKDAIGETYPAASIVRYEFPARGDKPPVSLTWFDGGLMPPHPKALEPERQLATNGALLFGDEGAIMHGSHGARSMRIIPESQMKTYELPEKTLPRVPGHHEDWIKACKSGKPASSNFDYSGPLTEMILLGVIATRFRNRKLLWDAKKMRITNDEEANACVNPQYREGWEL